MHKVTKHWKEAQATDLARFAALIEAKWLEWAKSTGKVVTVWFRGQANASWGLIPGLYRPPFNDVDEDAYRHEFHLRAHPFLPKPLTLPDPTGIGTS